MRGRKKKKDEVEEVDNGDGASMDLYGKQTKKKNKNKEVDNGFHGCYLLTSASPRYKGHTYIGYTVNPKRRIRQHNGEICSGAWTTKRKRPWEMVLCIHGFPSSTSALQFEWAWQHPRESLAVRELAAGFRAIGGVANKIKLGIAMIGLPSWVKLGLTVSFFSTKYMIHTAGAPSDVEIRFRCIDELLCYSHDVDVGDDGNDKDDTYEIINPNSDLSPQPLDDASQPLMDLESEQEETISNQPRCTPCIDEQVTQELDDLIDDNIKGNTQHDVDNDDDDDTYEIYPNSPTHPRPLYDVGQPLMEKPESEEETVFNHHSQLTLNTHITHLCTTSMEDGSVDDNIKGKTEEEETQVIDLLTPSPDTRIVRGSKKQRPQSKSPDFIDLTTSPLFIQL